MNNFERAQLAHDNAGPPDDDWNEPTDEHEEAAKDELADDPGALWDVYQGSVWQREHADYLYAKDMQFRSETDESCKDALTAMEHTSWWKEYICSLFTLSDNFREEVYRVNEKRIADRAQEIADAEADSQATEAAIDRWEARNEY